MGEVNTIGLDIAKSVFQVHGVDSDGEVVICKRVRRSKLLEFFAALPRCLIGIEACPSAHYWGRELNANDAAAICEAVTRPSMRFVPTKSEQQQCGLMLHRSRQLLVRQRTMLSNAIRGHLAELGIVSAKGRNGMAELLGIIANEGSNCIPATARLSLEVLARQYAAIAAEIGTIEKQIHAWHRSCEASRRLEEIPGIGPIIATALVAEVGGLEGILVWTQSGGLDWTGSQASFDQWQRPTWRNLKARQSIFAMAAGRWSYGSHPLCPTARHQAIVAGSSDGAPSAQSCCRRTCQQNCTHGLGRDGAR
jgi:transposase